MRVEGVSELHTPPISSLIIFFMSDENTVKGFTSVRPAFGQCVALRKLLMV